MFYWLFICWLFLQQQELEEAAIEPDDNKDEEEERLAQQPKHQSLAQKIYAENRVSNRTNTRLYLQLVLNITFFAFKIRYASHYKEKESKLYIFMTKVGPYQRKIAHNFTWTQPHFFINMSYLGSYSQ